MRDSLKETWLHEHGDKGAAWLRKLEDKHGLYEELGNAIFKFVEKKKGFFLTATDSQEDFKDLPKWKLVLCAVSCVKYVMLCCLCYPTGEHNTHIGSDAGGP